MNKALYDYYSFKIPAQFPELENSIKFEQDDDHSLIASNDQIEGELFNMGIDWDGSTPLPQNVEFGIWGNKNKSEYMVSPEYISLSEKFKKLFNLIKDSITSANIEVAIYENNSYSN